MTRFESDGKRKSKTRGEDESLRRLPTSCSLAKISSILFKLQRRLFSISSSLPLFLAYLYVPDLIAMARPPSSRLPRPTSLSWAAPQSQIPPPLPPSLRQVSPEKASTWFRRVARPDLEDGPRPAFWQRLTQLIGGGVTLGITGWMIGWMDFGEDEHCFSPVSSMRWGSIISINSSHSALS